MRCPHSTRAIRLGIIRGVAKERPISPLVLAELYDSGDASFLSQLLSYRGNYKPLVGLIERWKKDRRAWAARLKIEFILSRSIPQDARVVFKRLMKQAEADRDHEVMAAVLVASDRLVRRKRTKRYTYEDGETYATEVLRMRQPRERLFPSSLTTHYVRRRAWRYFRRLGFKEAATYRAAIAKALVRYDEDDVRRGENLLDNWGLMHALFGKSEQIAFSPRHTNLSASGNLANLQAAPMFERHWTVPEAAGELLALLLEAQCRPVRVWAIQMLRKHHTASLAKIDPAMLLRLIDHADADVAGFAAELLRNAHAVSAFPMPTWMSLLAVRNPAVVATIVEAFRQHVQFERVMLEQAVELAVRAPVPVAKLGLDVLTTKAVRSAADRAILAKLASAQCAAMAEAIARYAVPIVNAKGAYDLEAVTGFFDSRFDTMRSGAFAALANDSPAAMDPAFWARLFESPYDDVRVELVTRLKKRSSLPGASADGLALLWQSVLLNIHRGGRAKLTALRQISDQIVREPASAVTLLPILSIALRSVRGPEARHGLAAIVSAVERHPELTPLVRTRLPELQLDPIGGAR